MLAEYKLIVPDAGERFFNYMEREQLHRHENQTALVKQTGHAQNLVFTLSGIAILAATVCAVMGQAAGLGIAAVGVLPLVQAVWQRHKQAKIEQKALTNSIEHPGE